MIRSGIRRTTAFIVCALMSTAAVSLARVTNPPVTTDAAASPAFARTIDAMISELFGTSSGSKGVRRSGPVQFEGAAWQSGSGAAGTSHFGLQMDRAVTDALAARHIESHSGTVLGSKGVGGNVLRGGFKLLKGGMHVSLSLVDANSGRVISEVRRMLSRESLTGLAMDHLIPPDAGNARALAQLVSQSLGGGASEFRLQVTTNRGPQGAFFEDDALRLSVQADRDCYLRLYHISWNDRTLTMIFPNQGDRDSFLPAGAPRQFPSPGSTAEFVVSKPYGVDAIIAIASSTPFEDDAWVSSQWASSADTPAESPAQPSAPAPAVAPVPEAPTAPDAGLESRGVVRSGPYLATEHTTEARARDILAKGLIVRQGGAARPSTASRASAGGSVAQAAPSNEFSGNLQEGTGRTEPVTPAPRPATGAAKGMLAKASCYYTTLPKLGLRR